MAYDLTGMAAYAKSNGEVLISDLILKGQSFSQAGIRVEQGIKSTDKFADVAIGNTYLQDNSAGDPGSLSYSGGSTLKDISVTVKEICVKEKYIKSTLDSKIAQMQMRAGSDPSNPLPFADVLVNIKSQDIAKLNDVLLWQGDTTLTNVNLNKFDGWLTTVTATGSTSVSGGSAAALAASTAIATVNAIMNVALTAFPVWIDGCFMYMSPANYQTFYRATFGLASVIDKNSEGVGAPVLQFYIPGTNVLCMSTHGLQGKNNIVITRDSNFVVGTDLVSEDNTVNFEYLNEAQIWRLEAIYKLGAAIARQAEVVVTK
jgi:hypothetical protein